MLLKKPGIQIKSALVFLLLAHFSPSINSQNFLSNYGSLVSVKEGGFVSSNGDIINSNQGIFHNTDSIFLTGNWTNDAGNTAFDTGSSGKVIFWGNNERINGTDVTNFHDVELRGTGTKFADLDVVVINELDLNTLELNVDSNTIFIESPNISAVQTDGGFVSSVEAGGLSRKMNSSDAYLFPVGSSDNFWRYRPVEIRPLTTNQNTFKVRHAEEDATDEGFDRDVKELLICYINEEYYHRIYHSAGNDAVDLTFLYHELEDGDFNDETHWQNVPHWEKPDSVISGTFGIFDFMKLPGWADFSSPAFALAYVSQPFAETSEDTVIFLGDSLLLVASEGSFYNWSPSEFLSCDDCPTPLAFPVENTRFTVFIESDEGCIDSASVTVLVDENVDAGLFIPNAITPNNDGANDHWFIQGLERFDDNEVIILNRWGDEVFTSKNYENDWRGTYNGNDLPEGTYYFILKVSNSTFSKVYNGDLTVIR